MNFCSYRKLGPWVKFSFWPVFVRPCELDAVFTFLKRYNKDYVEEIACVLRSLKCLLSEPWCRKPADSWMSHLFPSVIHCFLTSHLYLEFLSFFFFRAFHSIAFISLFIVNSKYHTVMKMAVFINESTWVKGRDEKMQDPFSEHKWKNVENSYLGA